MIWNIVVLFDSCIHGKFQMNSKVLLFESMTKKKKNKKYSLQSSSSSLNTQSGTLSQRLAKAIQKLLFVHSNSLSKQPETTKINKIFILRETIFQIFQSSIKDLNWMERFLNWTRAFKLTLQINAMKCSKAPQKKAIKIKGCLNNDKISVISPKNYLRTPPKNAGGGGRKQPGKFIHKVEKI